MDHSTKIHFISTIISFDRLTKELMHNLMTDGYFDISDLCQAILLTHFNETNNVLIVADLLFEYNIYNNGTWLSLFQQINFSYTEPIIELLDKVCSVVENLKLTFKILIKLPLKPFLKYYQTDSTYLESISYLGSEHFVDPQVILYLINEALDNGLKDFHKNIMHKIMKKHILISRTDTKLDKYVRVCEEKGMSLNEQLSFFIDFYEIVNEYLSNTSQTNIPIKYDIEEQIIYPSLTSDIADWMCFKINIKSVTDEIRKNSSDRMKKYAPYVYDFLLNRNLDECCGGDYMEGEDSWHDGVLYNVISLCERYDGTIAAYFPKVNMSLKEMLGDDMCWFDRPLEDQLALLQKVLDLMEQSTELNEFINNHS